MSAVSKHIANFRHFREALTDVLLGVCIYLSRYLRACLYVGQRVRFIHLFEISLPTEYVSCSLQMCVVVTSYVISSTKCMSVNLETKSTKHKSFSFLQEQLSMEIQFGLCLCTISSQN